MPTNEPPFGSNPDTPGSELPKPWQKPPQEEEEGQGGFQGIDGIDTGGAIDAASIGGDLLSGTADAASAGADLLGGAADVASGAIEGAGSALEALGGCAEGCGGCSLAVLVTLFAAAGTAMAFFR